MDFARVERETRAYEGSADRDELGLHGVRSQCIREGAGRDLPYEH